MAAHISVKCPRQGHPLDMVVTTSNADGVPFNGSHVDARADTVGDVFSNAVSDVTDPASAR